MKDAANRSTAGSPPSLPEAYGAWRRSELGRLADDIEADLLLGALGDVHGKCILDVGCGDGAFAARLAERGAAVTGIDADTGMIAIASASDAAVRFMVASAEALPFPNAAFDAVTLVTVMCLCADRGAILDEAVRVLRPGGRLVIGELGRCSLWALHRRMKGWLGNERWRRAHFHSLKELRGLAERAGLHRIECTTGVYFPPVTTPARLLAPYDQHLAPLLGPVGAAFIVVAGQRPG